MDHAQHKITPQLMFSGQAEEAMRYYLSIFDQAEILSLERYGANDVGAEGTVMRATLSLYGHRFMCIDSSVPHDFTFTPAISLAITCTTEEESERLFGQLARDGSVFMPLAAYPFSPKFGWVADKYGVSWQVILDDQVR